MLSREEVIHLSQLVRMGLTDEEIEKFRVQLSNILENFEIIKQADTSDLKATAQAIELKNIFRDDSSKPSYPVEDILRNAPDRENNSFKVPPVLE